MGILKNKFINNHKGVTLIEVLAAFTLLTVILATYLNLIGTTRLATKQSDETITALSYAQQIANEIQITPTSAKILEYHDTVQIIDNKTYNIYIDKIPYLGPEITVHREPAMQNHLVSIPTLVYANFGQTSSLPYLITVSVSWN